MTTADDGATYTVIAGTVHTLQALQAFGALELGWGGGQKRSLFWLLTSRSAMWLVGFSCSSPVAYQPLCGI
jgi:hypothetical protein